MTYLLTVLPGEEGMSVETFADGKDAVSAYTRVVTSGRPCTLTDAGLPGIEPVVVGTYAGRPGPRDRAIVRSADDGLMALWFAKGYLYSLGPLSPLDVTYEPDTFSRWFIASEYENVSQAWAVWFDQRRAEVDR